MRPLEIMMHFRNATPTRNASGWTLEWPSVAAISILCRGAILAILVVGILMHRIVI